MEATISAPRFQAESRIASHVDVDPNPLAQKIMKRLLPLLSAIDKVSGSLFIDADCSDGLEKDADGLRPATDDECTRIKFMFRMDGEIDCRQKLIPQLTKWLRRCAADIDIARIGIENLDAVDRPAAESKGGVV